MKSVIQAGFECLRKNGFDFFAGRVGTEVGTVDHTGVQNVKDALDGQREKYEYSLPKCCLISVI